MRGSHSVVSLLDETKLDFANLISLSFAHQRRADRMFYRLTNFFFDQTCYWSVDAWVAILEFSNNRMKEWCSPAGSPRLENVTICVDRCHSPWRHPNFKRATFSDLRLCYWTVWKLNTMINILQTNRPKLASDSLGYLRAPLAAIKLLIIEHPNIETYSLNSIQ